LNGVTNITVFPLAVSDRSSEVSLFTDGVDGRSPSLANLGQRDAVLVPCESLDHMLAAGRIDPPNVIKMDIEGAEFLALSGARTLLESENRPRAIFLEVHPHYLVKFGHTITELEQFLINCGYREEKRRVRDIQYHVILRA
jgi:FkbM family methyltransferase